jgi:citrate synthase
MDVSVNVDRMINMSDAWITAAAAAALLDVTRPTLYAYVSRGMVRSQRGTGSSRERRYAREDVERLRRRAEERREPDKAAARALQWGVPVLESGITLIDGARLFYRGADALALAASRPVDEVASLIWSGHVNLRRPAGQVVTPPPETDYSFIPRAQRMLAAAADQDPSSADLRPERAVVSGWRILDLVTAAAAGRRPGSLPIERALARGWRLPIRHAGALRSALILCADHELNVSSFTARCVASAGSSLYAVVIAGLSAMQGSRHGGASARVGAMLDALRSSRDVPAAMAARLRRGDAVEGFGHPLYPGGDPRAAMILDDLARHHGRSAELSFVTRVAAAGRAAVGDAPNVDFALAALSRVLRLPPDAPLALFAVGRTIGWIGHALEQYATNQLIRPRARYVGVAPPQPGV